MLPCSSRVADVTNAPNMYIETSPMRDERLFTGTVGAFAPTARVTADLVHNGTAAYPLGRYFRGAWSATAAAISS
jgi:hypothetical protein